MYKVEVHFPPPPILWHLHKKSEGCACEAYFSVLCLTDVHASLSPSIPHHLYYRGYTPCLQIKHSDPPYVSSSFPNYFELRQIL